MNIYVGNLSYEMNDEELMTTFSEYGEVESARVISDRYSGRSRGFGFVEMLDDSQAQASIDGLNGKEVQGRTLTVNEARPRGADGGGAGGGGARRGGPRF